MRRLFGWIRIGLIDLRGDLRRFGLLIACLALGTSVIAAVGSVGAVLKYAIEQDATALMGGDIEVSRPDRDANPRELAFLRTLGSVAQVVDTNARATAGDNTALLDLVAVDGNYPLLGHVASPQLKAGQKPAALLGRTNGVYGAIVDPVMFDRLGIGLGDEFTINDVTFQVRGTLGSLPDGAVRGFHLGLTTLISTTALNAMSDLRAPLPGLLTRHSYKIELSGLTYDQAAAAITRHLRGNGWTLRSPRDAVGPMVRYYDLFSRYLLIIGLSSLLVGGVGVSNGVATYIGERQRTIATLRTLGATGARIMVHYLAQVGVLVTIGAGLGVLLGALASLVMLPFVGRALNITLPAMVVPLPLVTAAAFGILVGFAFAYLPLARARKVSPALLFRSLGTLPTRSDWSVWSRPVVLMPMFVAAAGILLLAAYETSDATLVGLYALGVALTYGLLRGAAWALQVVLRHLPPAPFARLRNVLRNIYRPGSSAPVIVVSIGLGLSMVLLMALLETNLRDQLLGSITRDAPSFVATDLFSDEVSNLDKMAKSDSDIASFESHPMLRGALLGINGHKPHRFGNRTGDAGFLLSGEIPITWARSVPEGSNVVAGKWWPSDYSGPPLVSVRSTLRSELGLKVGDTLQIRLFGDKIDARIANFREYHWQKGINFLITFSPGRIEAYPSTYLGAVKATKGHEKDVERALVRAFPDVAFIPVGDALRQAAALLGQLGAAVNVVGSLAVMNGLLVLAGTMVAGRKQRESDAVIEKVLGATRGGILQDFVLEHAVLGAYAALVASLVGVLGAWAITVNMLGMDFAVSPFIILLVAAVAVILTIAAGATTTWRALSVPPARYLRNI